MSTTLIAGPYRPASVRVGETLYDHLRGRRAKVTAWKDTSFGPWPSAGRDQARPIVCDELLRAIETEAATAVAHHWNVAVSTAVRWRLRAGLADPRNTVPGTTRALKDSSVASAPQRIAASIAAHTVWTPEDDVRLATASTLADAAAMFPAASLSAVKMRRSRKGLAGAAGRPAARPDHRVYGCYAVVGPTTGRHASGEVLWEAVCRCGARKTLPLSKLRRATVRCRFCPKSK